MENNKIRVAFLFLDQMHHVYHASPVAFELSTDSRFNVLMLTSSMHNLDLFKKLEKYYPDHKVKFGFLKTTFFSRIGQILKKKPYPTVRSVLKKNEKFINTFDALVTPDDCLHYIMKRDKKRKLKYITTLHGAGDNQPKPRYTGFDYILFPGKERRELMNNQMAKHGILNIPKSKIVGYPKFDITLRNQDKAKLFENGNPVVIYNPHSAPEKSSWDIWGEKVLDYFYNNRNFNLIFAPHIMMFAKRKNNLPKKYYKAENIYIDLDSNALLDMTYTKSANIYLGDLSSQVYEFIVNPRPCVFLNGHRADWKEDIIFSRWYLGDVVEDFNEFENLLLTASDRHKHYIKKQIDCINKTFSQTEIPAGRRAAYAVANFLSNEE